MWEVIGNLFGAALICASAVWHYRTVHKVETAIRAEVDRKAALDASFLLQLAAMSERMSPVFKRSRAEGVS